KRLLLRTQGVAIGVGSLMIAASRCDCLICHLERTLVAEFSGDSSLQQFRVFSISIPALSTLMTPFELIDELHHHRTPDQKALGDQLIANLVGRKDDVAFHSIRQKLLLLAFIPTVHRTTSQVAASFPSLTREDIAQHVFSVLLEFLDSSELRA